MMYTRRKFLKLAVASAALPGALNACSRPPARSSPAFESGIYRNLFAERGKGAPEIAAKIDAAWQSLFASGDDNRRVYCPAGENEHGPLASIKDIGNNDIRTEGMSYGMMIAVQLDKQPEFNAIWNWAKTYMQHQQGDWKDYFSWHNREDGSQIDMNPALGADRCEPGRIEASNDTEFG